MWMCVAIRELVWQSRGRCVWGAGGRADSKTNSVMNVLIVMSVSARLGEPGECDGLVREVTVFDVDYVTMTSVRVLFVEIGHVQRMHGRLLFFFFLFFGMDWLHRIPCV